MKDSTLKTLQNCYTHSPSLVLIMDMDWQILWSNRKQHPIRYLPQQLSISPDHTDNSTHLFSCDGRMQECRLLCNQQDGYRIAEILPYSQTKLTNLKMDVDAITTSVQSMTSACQALCNELNALELNDQTYLLNTIIGNCYRIYRMAYLQKELDRLQTGNRRNLTFSVNACLKNLYQKCRNLLHSCVNTELENHPEEIYLQGDMDEFLMAVLSAIVLCYQKNGCYQSLQLSLSMEDGMACLQVRVEQLGTELPEHIRRSDFISAGDYESERALLTLFCQQHGGKYFVTGQAAEGICTCRIYFQPYSGSIGSLTLNSPQDMREETIYNKYATMLSCIHYRTIF